MTSAFDTINRSKLIDICETFLEEDEIRIIRTLLSNTSLELLCGQTSKTIPTLVGSPQGDGLSPTLFIMYLREPLKKSEHQYKLTVKKASQNCHMLTMLTSFSASLQKQKTITT
ncbi:very-long-chain enoyl-CoA reductase [Elysia marginata]|uniref:Very-long-chain enoyl-CoA reductase n=1 Tax=Elysia marginata TaxID=1093978 RepID=A0AAV4GT64_9GAST|nr:very-long-chain enoyl-CoA reductase [Elysia marginata]